MPRKFKLYGSFNSQDLTLLTVLSPRLSKHRQRIPVTYICAYNWKSFSGHSYRATRNLKGLQFYYRYYCQCNLSQRGQNSGDLTRRTSFKSLAQVTPLVFIQYFVPSFRSIIPFWKEPEPIFFPRTNVFGVSLAGSGVSSRTASLVLSIPLWPITLNWFLDL